MEELKRKLSELEKEVENLRKSLAKLEEQQKSASKKEEEKSPSTAKSEEQQKSAAKKEEKPPSKQPAGPAVPKSSARRDRPITDLAKQDSVNRDRETVARIHNQPLDPELVGFFHIPGTEAKLKIDGYAKLDVIMDPRPAGDPDQFITTTIPVNLTPTQKVVRSNVNFRESRINLDFRSPVFEDDEFRFFAEIDFNGPDGPTDPRLRHLYGQARNILAGHTWSTFADPDIIPDTLDFQSPAGIIKTRQAQFRYTQPVGKHHSFAFAVERPSVRGFDIEDDGSLIRSSVVRGFLREGEEADLRLFVRRLLDLSPDDGPYNPAPDFVARYRYERHRGHLQFGSLYRVLGFQSAIVEDKAFGWGLNFSSGILVGKRDNLLLSATYGEGIARYISNLSILDLDYDLDNDGRFIRALPVIGVIGAYQHYWTKQLRSTVTFGFDRVQNTALQPGDIFSKSYYTSGNLIWRPLKHYRFTVGAEFLYGWQVLKDNSKGRANRVQVSLQYNLYRKPGDPTP
jgi:DcaP outer membrane protein